jgi:tRNA(Ile)-lysidine synthase
MPSHLPQTLYCDDPSAIGDTLGAHVRRHRLFRGVSRLGLAISGGADSVALLHVFLPMCRSRGIDVTVLHADHGLRAESARDAAFVRSLASENGLPFLTDHLHLSAREPDGASVEMAARSARHAFFASCCRAAGLDAVATGHQADDVAETLLLRLTRGAGCAGLSALRPRTPAPPERIRAAGRPYAMLRPLLPFSGRALREWLTRNNLPWCEDASNQSCDIPRNRMRHLVLPQVEAAWGAPLRPSLCRSADILREEDALLDQLASRRLKAAQDVTGALDLHRLRRAPEALRRRALRLWLFEHGLPDACGYDTVCRLLDACATRQPAILQLNATHRAFAVDGRLRLDNGTPTPPAAVELAPAGCVTWGDLEIRSECARGVHSEALGVGRYPAVCSLSAERVDGKPLLVRSRQPGDRIAPTGFDGSKKLHDVFVDAKVPEADRDAIPVFVCRDEVVWVPGYRIARAYAVPSPDAPSLRLTARAQATHAT